MIHLGIDHHKRYSHVVALRDSGEVVWEGQLGSDREAFEALKQALPADEPVQSVLEAGRNWGPLFDALEALGLHPCLANPLKTRWIAESYVKTDKIDATIHATLLKAGLTPRVHVPERSVRDQRQLLRQRLWLVRWQTGLKNRIHNLLDRNHVQAPEVTDLFGVMGLAWMKALKLPDLDQRLLQADLSLLAQLRQQIRQTEQWIAEVLSDNAAIPILESLPGIGKVLGALIALEIDTIERFSSPSKLCAYSGLANSTYSSGGKTRHGGLIPTCNHHLRYAFIEGAWGAIRVSPYFRDRFKRMKARKGAHDAIGATARTLCEITFHCLKQKRLYIERPYRYRPAALVRP